MNTQAQGTKVTRERAYLRTYNYDAGTGSVNTPTGTPVVSFDLSTFPPEVQKKLALSGLMALVAGAGVEANREGEDGTAAMQSILTGLADDSIEFSQGTGIGMGGVLKRIARALVALGKTHAKAPNGSVLSWPAGDIGAAHAAMRTLWDMPASPEGTNPAYESGKARVNRIKATPEVNAKLAQYAAAKGNVEVDLIG